MSGYNYCRNCGGGPININLNSYCRTCSVLQNNASHPISHDYHTDTHTLHVHPHAHSSRSKSTSAKSRGAQDTLTRNSAHTIYSSGAPSYDVFPTGNTPYTAPYSQRPERTPVYRWQCCRCGGDNSYKTDRGCAVCCNHWRDRCCHTYDANN